MGFTKVGAGVSEDGIGLAMEVAGDGVRDSAAEDDGDFSVGGPEGECEIGIELLDLTLVAEIGAVIDVMNPRSRMGRGERGDDVQELAAIVVGLADIRSLGIIADVGTGVGCGAGEMAFGDEESLAVIAN